MSVITNHPRVAGIALSAVLALQLMLQLDAQVMTVALPNVQAELGFSAASLSWVPNAYALAFGGLILLGGRLGDAFGRVRVFSIGTTACVSRLSALPSQNRDRAQARFQSGGVRRSRGCPSRPGCRSIPSENDRSA